jgi:hypothetical protein
VQASPCTWTQVLAAFPNIGIHAAYGAVVLKAGSGWSSFRGNVDNLTISLDGVATTYNFELTQSAARFHLRTDIGVGVTTNHMPVDSDYTAGATVSFSFGVGAGYDSLVVFVDDTIAPSAGQIVMDHDHTIGAGVNPHIQVDAQTLTIGTRIRSMLAANDKVTAYYSFFDWYMDQAAITDPDAETSFGMRRACDGSMRWPAGCARRWSRACPRPCSRSP